MLISPTDASFDSVQDNPSWHTKAVRGCPTHQRRVDIKFDVVLRRNAYMAIRRRITAGTEDVGALKSAVHQLINIDADTGRREQFLSRKFDASGDHQTLLDALDLAHLIRSPWLIPEQGCR